MVQASARRLKAAQAVTHGAPCCELDKGHYGELLLEFELA